MPMPDARAFMDRWKASERCDLLGVPHPDPPPPSPQARAGHPRKVDHDGTVRGVMDDVRSCYRCHHETPQALEHCPQCGHPLMTAQAVSSRGWLLLVLGLLLTGGIVVLAVLILHNLDNFTGGVAMLVFTFTVLYVVLGIGVIALVNGAYQIRYRRRHHKLAHLFLWLGAMFLALGLLARALELLE